jgi:histidyl-tRNA synthetase
VAVDILRELGLTAADVRARVSDRRLLRAILLHDGVEEDQLPAAYAAIDKLERDPRDVLASRLASAGIADAAADRIFALPGYADLDALAGAYAGAPELDAHVDRLRRYFEYLRALGVGDWVRLDLSIVRGLAYYTGIVFELFDAQGELRAICGGGRYDALLGALGGADLPALGFGMGDVVLAELLRARGLMPPSAPRLDFWVAADDAALLPMVMGTATLLRRVGHSVEYALREQSLAKQLKAADAAGAQVAAILRRDAIVERREVTLRRLSDGVEDTVALQTWLDYVTSRAAPAAPGVAPGAAPEEPAGGDGQPAAAQ